MRIIFDQGTPVPLHRVLIDHAVSTAFEMGWTTLDNGALLAAAEGQFDALITTDRNLRYQQNLAGRKLAILVLPTTSWPAIQARRNEVTAAVEALRPGDFVELSFDP
jgi:hypothetical protein